MKVFKDLVFEKARNGGIGAKIELDNGFVISAIAGENACSSPREDKDSPDDFRSFEVAVFDSNGDWATKQFVACDDVLGWRSRDQINELMLHIQSKDGRVFHKL